jgi:hypothetical protein
MVVRWVLRGATVGPPALRVKRKALLVSRRRQVGAGLRERRSPRTDELAGEHWNVRLGGPMRRDRPSRAGVERCRLRDRVSAQHDRAQDGRGRLLYPWREMVGTPGGPRRSRQSAVQIMGPRPCGDRSSGERSVPARPAADVRIQHRRGVILGVDAVVVQRASGSPGKRLGLYR